MLIQVVPTMSIHCVSIMLILFISTITIHYFLRHIFDGAIRKTIVAPTNIPAAAVIVVLIVLVVFFVIIIHLCFSMVMILCGA